VVEQAAASASEHPQAKASSGEPVPTLRVTSI